jgi:glycosyltransferase involved in cell wall biosynthesis
LLVPPSRPAELAVAIGQAVTSPELLLEIGRRARQIFEERYTQERMLSCYHQLYVSSLKEIDSAYSVSPILSSINR